LTPKKDALDKIVGEVAPTVSKKYLKKAVQGMQVSSDLKMVARVADDGAKFKSDVERYVKKLNTEAERIVEGGKQYPLYQDFGFTMGPTYARIFNFSNKARTDRNVRAFYGRDGVLYRADSWKKVGRPLGDPDNQKNVEYILGPLLQAR